MFMQDGVDTVEGGVSNSMVYYIIVFTLCTATVYPVITQLHYAYTPQSTQLRLQQQFAATGWPQSRRKKIPWVFQAFPEP